MLRKAIVPADICALELLLMRATQKLREIEIAMARWKWFGAAMIRDPDWRQDAAGRCFVRMTRTVVQVTSARAVAA
jgi:hypothetical protein